jgi:hypothetical protein
MTWVELRNNPLDDTERGEWTNKMLFYGLVCVISFIVACLYLPALYCASLRATPRLRLELLLRAPARVSFRLEKERPNPGTAKTIVGRMARSRPTNREISLSMRRRQNVTETTRKTCGAGQA